MPYGVRSKRLKKVRTEKCCVSRLMGQRYLLVPEVYSSHEHSPGCDSGIDTVSVRNYICDALLNTVVAR